MLTDCEERLRELLKMLSVEGKKDGVKVNTEKYSIMCIDRAQTKPSIGIVINENTLKVINIYSYQRND